MTANVDLDKLRRDMADDDGWYFEDNGQQSGPHKLGYLRGRTAVGAIRDDTLVWHASLGPSWITARTAGLTSAIDGVGPPPLPPGTVKPATSPSVVLPPAPRKKVSRTGFLIFLLACVGLAVWNWSEQLGLTGPTFTDAEISRVKQSIRDKWRSEKSVKSVGDVVMFRKSSTELTGYVELTFDGGFTSTKSCTATMDTQKASYFWQCR